MEAMNAVSKEAESSSLEWPDYVVIGNYLTYSKNIFTQCITSHQNLTTVNSIRYSQFIFLFPYFTAVYFIGILGVGLWVRFCADCQLII